MEVLAEFCGSGGGSSGGQVAGSVSGGCVEDDLIRRVQAEILTRSTPEMVVYGVSKEEASRFGLPCGGTLRLFVEPRPDLSVLEELLKSISNHRIIRRRIDLQTGISSLGPGNRNDLFLCNEQFVQTTYGPRWRMVIIGAGQLSLYVADFAVASDFEVIVIDPREEYSEGIDRDDVLFVKGMPDDTLIELSIDPHTAIVALTHDPKLDDLALMEALKSPAFYVGALGSRLNTQKRKVRLMEFDLNREQIERLHGPVGIYIGALTPSEIAVSIMAEVIAVKSRITFPKK